MTASDTTPALHLEAPGPGPWTQDGVHFPRPMTRYFQDMHPAAFKASYQASSDQNERSGYMRSFRASIVAAACSSSSSTSSRL